MSAAVALIAVNIDPTPIRAESPVVARSPSTSSAAAARYEQLKARLAAQARESNADQVDAATPGDLDASSSPVTDDAIDLDLPPSPLFTTESSPWLGARDIPVKSASTSREAHQGGESAPELEAAEIGGRRRRVRHITEIEPFPNADADRDIRSYAREQALEMGADYGSQPYAERVFPGLAAAWEPSNLFYRPLYFEDVPLERYGHTHGLLQPIKSIGKFSVQLIGLPYQMTIDPPHTCNSGLGYYRPGDCAPHLHYQVPLNGKAALVEGLFITGMVFVLLP